MKNGAVSGGPYLRGLRLFGGVRHGLCLGGLHLGVAAQVEFESPF